MPIIPYAKQTILADDIAAVTEVLRSDWLTQGPAIERFEMAVANYCGVAHAVATCNATAALHLACRALDLTANDILWTSPNTFVASANCALYCGAKVDFVDIDPATFNLCADALEKKLQRAKKEGKLPRIVIPVHFAGQSCDMEKIAYLAKQYGFFVIEDASHSIGGYYQNKPIGNGQYADVTIFSFHPVKIITTGEGGMLVTKHANIATQARLLRSHGITRDSGMMVSETEGPWYYQQIDQGYNYRMTDIQAALGVRQLQQLNEFIKRRQYLAKRYAEKLTDLPLQLPVQHHDCYSAWHLYVIQLQLENIKQSRREVVESLHQAGIKVNVHYIPVHTQPYYQQLGFRVGDYPVAENYYQRAISLPMYYGLTDVEQDTVIATLRDILQ